MGDTIFRDLETGEWSRGRPQRRRRFSDYQPQDHQLASGNVQYNSSAAAARIRSILLIDT